MIVMVIMILVFVCVGNGVALGFSPTLVELLEFS